MILRVRKAALLAILLLTYASFVQACAAKPTLTGTWISEAPASLHYEFRSDGSVWVKTDQTSRQIWRYEVENNRLLDLYDGLGRKREVRFAIQNDILTFYDPTTGISIEKYTRGDP